MVGRVFQDFDVRLARFRSDGGGGGRLSVWVEGETPGGAMFPDDEAEVVWDPTVLWEHPASLFGGLAGGLEESRVEERHLRELGGVLADLALPAGTVRDLFWDSLTVVTAVGEGLRLRLHVDPVELAAVPWEFIMLPDAKGGAVTTDFLAFREEISIVRTATVESMPHPLPTRDRYRVVGVLSSPSDEVRLDLAGDREAVEVPARVFNATRDEPVVECAWVEDPASLEQLREALGAGAADVFHFGGHGRFDPATQEGVILLERPADGSSDVLGSDELGVLLRRAGVRLAVLGACEGSRGDRKNAWSGVAQALTRQRVPAVVGSQLPIRDDLAAILVKELYGGVLSSGTVDEALAKARTAVESVAGLECPAWGALTLFLHDRDGVLFPEPPEGKVTDMQRTLIKVAQHIGEVNNATVIGVHIGRMRSGALNVEQDVDTVRGTGTVVGVDVDEVQGGKVTAKSDIGTVEEGGTVTGVKINELG